MRNGNRVAASATLSLPLASIAPPLLHHPSLLCVKFEYVGLIWFAGVVCIYLTRILGVGEGVVTCLEGV